MSSELLMIQYSRFQTCMSMSDEHTWWYWCKTRNCLFWMKGIFWWAEYDRFNKNLWKCFCISGSKPHPYCVLSIQNISKFLTSEGLIDIKITILKWSRWRKPTMMTSDTTNYDQLCEERVKSGHFSQLTKLLSRYWELCFTTNSVEYIFLFKIWVIFVCPDRLQLGRIF